MYRCKVCSKEKQTEYSMRYYYNKGKERRRMISKFYRDNKDVIIPNASNNTE
jgi:hypothetical protein